ncbi:efflux RND transporter periplasmic adaptor subunit [Salinarimonas soli]|uniref:Efflux RND transporter periplasmic adaptor subunit n=1 Tax=Salinarimonas soli TaxID=1638099 RepID=A0A5B2VEA3_9HYPH|nr:efflux RND transporter periplasmic adaptor subunit [Salinarimonas soli]KAA2236752.1 efflux RND transporter periplasmic adaptor subunit [Salinarimonas soli]
MRWYGQLAVIAVIGGLGYGAWHVHQTGQWQQVAAVPVIGPVIAPYLPQAPAAGAAAQQPGRGGPPGRGSPGGPALVDVDTVKTARIVDTRQAVGTVRANESITVTAKVSGVVAEIRFQEGQLVKPGDVLLRFETDERRADIESAAAEIQRASAQRDEIRGRLERAQALRRTGAGTEAQVEDLSAQVRSAESAVTAAEARRRAAEARMDDLIVRAPFAGRIGSRSISLGAYVSPGTRITSLDDLSKVRVDFAVPENLLGQLKVGQTVRAMSAAFTERAFTGKVTLLDPRVEPTTRTVKLTAEFENGDETLRPGMFLSVALEVLERENAVVVPEEAVVNEGLRHIVYVVADNKVERRVITIGQRQAAGVEVVDGVKPGETIVVRGVQRVRAGAAVNPRPIGAPGATPGEARPAGTPAPGGTRPAAARTDNNALPAERRG